MEYLNIQTAVILGTPIIIVMIGSFVFFKNPRGGANRFFCYFSLVIALWNIGDSLALFFQQNPAIAVLLYRISTIAGPLFVWFWIRLYCELVGDVTLPKPVRWTMNTITPLMSLVMLSPLIIEDINYPPEGGFSEVQGPAYFIYRLYILWGAFYGLYRLLIFSRRAAASKRIQVQYLLSAFAMVCSGVVVYAMGSFAPIANIIYTSGLPIYLIYYLLEIGYSLTVAYAILQHGALDIRTVIHKTLLWFLTSSAIIFPAALSFWFLRPWLIEQPGIEMILIVTLFLGLLVYARHIQPRIDHLFQRRKYDMQKILQGMVKELVLLNDLQGLTNKIVATIREALYVSNSSIILFERKKGLYSIVSGQASGIDLSTHNAFMNWMRKEDRVIEWSEIEVDPRYAEVKVLARQYFEALSTKVALPLIHDRNLIGVINLGEKDNLKPFTRSDIEFLSNLRAEASIALSNSLLYDDVQKMSETLRQWALDLEKKVEERTHELSESKAELERSYKKLQELDQVKTQFFANISHELRTPLTLILAPLESILHREGLSGDRKEDLNSMYQNGLRLLKLINNLLDLAKIDAGKMQLSYLKTDFTKFIKGIIASVSPMAEKKELTLSFTGPDHLSEFFFDRDKLEKVLLNIIFNSLKFTNPGGRVDVSCEQREDQLLVRVSDTGIGIAKENIHKLFNRFSQVEASSNRRFEGTGIGLALSKELIELHKGEIWAESELGKGTVIAFTIPYLIDPICIPETEEGGGMEWTRSLHQAAEYTTAGVVQAAQPMKGPSPNGAPAGAPKILVVEDNPDMLHFLVTQLQDDYQVITAQNGVEGVQRAQTDLPNLILSDVMMPIKDGYQLCREVKENALTKHIPIVLISAKADLSMKIEGLEYGADDYLTKPFSCEELRARIKSLLNQRGLETQLIHSEKMAALGLLVAGMAHEINNPISFAKVSLDNLRNTLTEHDRLFREGTAADSAEMKRINDKISRAFSIIKTGLDRTEAIISDLKAFVRKDEGQFRPTDLHAGLDSTLNIMTPELRDRITVIKEYGEIELVEAVPGQINQVFMNLFQNAIHAIADEGEIRIRTWKEEDRVKISVKDSGTGISPEHQKRIFEPFFTTKETGKGTGLGLSVSYRILQSHRGDITVVSRQGQGTEFVITLPVRQMIGAAH